MDKDARSAKHACDACRAKKYKCTKERPSCQLCLQQKRTCHYSGQITRTPLTRVHLTHVENRVHKLEALFARLNPDVDLETALSQNDIATPTGSTDLSSSIRSEDFKPLECLNQPRQETPPYEALPQEADGFDWKEETTDVDDLADGMASLTVEPSGIGYLGSTSGVGFLRAFLVWTRKNAVSGVLNEPAILQLAQRHAQQQSLYVQHIPENAIGHQLAASLIDAYFTNYHTSYPFIHEATFRAQYNALIKRPEKRAWHMLLHTVLALGAWTISDGTNDLDDVLYRKARSYSQEEESLFESGSLSLVQALLLLSNLSQKGNKPNTGWNYLGLAVRMAISLGFHRELPEWNISLFQREVRRRVWWGLFIFDSGASTTFGRAILLPRKEMVDVKSVMNIADEDLVPITEEVPRQRSEPTIYSSLIAQSRFHVISNSISDRLLSSPVVSANEALTLNAVLGSWAATLPWYFQLDQPIALPYDWYLFARQKLWWRYWNLQILLMRPHLLTWAMRRMGGQGTLEDTAEEAKCRKICLDSAHSTLSTANIYIRENTLTRLTSWYTLFFTFHAVLIPSVCLCVDPAAPEAQAWQEDIDATRDLMLFAFGGNPLAQRCLDILNCLVPKQGLGRVDGGLFASTSDPTQDDLESWLVDPADPMNMFGWTDVGQDLWQFP
ncbi:hypothetical protein AAFC00_002334 [Neodothiora populina]|uniref:Zn(2)-C6 fungal-type domain-containing protein n=1 Tax=Neodothiora populina TaxID=2781224 RepID=A0ABR3PIA1_9PEZI